MSTPPAKSSSRLPWYAWPLVPSFALVAFAIMLPLGLVVLLSIPVAGAMASLQAIGERRYRRRMAGRGRFSAWADLVPVLEAGQGTLIIEQANKCPVRVWWTPDDVLALAPCPPPAAEELDISGCRSAEPHEFVAWCHRRYLDEDAGSARLTHPALALPPGLFFARFFEGRFPQITAIDTVYCRMRGTPRAS